MKRGKLSNLSLMAMLLILFLGFTYLWQSTASEGKLTYSQVRQLFLQEKVDVGAELVDISRY